jgi:uncharacterized membrane protein
MKKKRALILSIILTLFAIAAYLYPVMPERMISHWNSEGIPDGKTTKFWSLFLMPIISLFLFLMFVFIPKIDPLKKNIEKFRKQFENLILVIIIFLFYIYILTLFWNFGYKFDMNKAIIPATGLFIFYTGTVLEKAKRNWFVGIRTPWTLSSDEVWNKTNKLGAKVFKVAGIVSFFGMIFTSLAIYFLLVPLLGGVVYIMAYSYFEYQKVVKRKES